MNTVSDITVRKNGSSYDEQLSRLKDAARTIKEIQAKHSVESLSREIDQLKKASTMQNLHDDTLRSKILNELRLRSMARQILSLEIE